MRKLILLMVLLMLPSFAYVIDGDTFTFRREILNTTSDMEGFIIPLNSTFSDIDSNSLSELYYGEFYTSAFLYYNNENDTVFNNGTGLYKYQTLPLVNVTGTYTDSKNIISYYPFDRGDTNAWEISGQGSNGTISASGITQEATGQVGYAYGFDGANGEVDTGTLFQEDEDFSLAFWVNANTISASGNDIFSEGSELSDTPFLRATIRDFDGSDGLGLIKRTVFFIRDNVDGTVDVHVLGKTPLVTSQWYQMVYTWDQSGQVIKMYLDGVPQELTIVVNTSVGATDLNNGQIGVLDRTGFSNYFDGKIDDFRVYGKILTATEIEALYNATKYVYLGGQEGDLLLSASPSPGVKNFNVNNSVVTLTNYTNFWWDIDNGNTSYHTTVPYLIHNYTTSGTFIINVTGFNSDTGTNTTTNNSLTINEPSTATVLGINNFLPFIFDTLTTTLNYTLADGSNIENSSYTITLPNSTIETYINQTSFLFSNRVSGQHVVDLTACDLVTNQCFTDSSSFKTWNVTGAVHVATIFNTTSNLIGELYYGDSITFSSIDSLTWTINSVSSTGTEKILVLNSTDAYFNDVNNYYYNLTAFISWGAYNSTKYISLASANYTIGQTTTCTSNLYCVVGGVVRDEGHPSDAFTSAIYGNTILTSQLYGHSREWSAVTTDTTLNLTMCVNATPINNYLLLDGTITYTGVDSAHSSHVTRTYAWQNSNNTLAYPCNVANGNYYTFYTITDGNSTDTTLTVLLGGAELTDAIVKFQSYINGNWVTVGSQISNANGEVQLGIELCPHFYKIIVEKGGVQLHNDNFCFPSASETLEVTVPNLEFYDVYSGAVGFCSYNNVTDVVSCSISEPSGRTITSELNVYQQFALDPICIETESSTTTTLVCSMSAYNIGDFRYALSVLSSDSEYVIATGSFAKGSSATFSTDGAIVALLILTVVILGARLPPLFSILLATFTLLGVTAMKLISLGSGAIGWILTLAIIAIIGLIRGSRK